MRGFGRGFRRMILMGWVPFFITGAFILNVHAQWVSVAPPEVSANWGLNKGKILPSGDGLIVGTDAANKQGVILRFKNHSWTVVDPPNVSSNWELNAVGFSAVNDAWAVGVDYSTGSRSGVILRYLNGLWSIFPSPFVSLDWGLYDVSFSGSSEGWAVGVDYSSQRGVLLRYKAGVWSSFVPPEVSLDWGLYGIHMINSTEAWAVGQDRTNKRGVLLRYTKDLEDKNRQKRFIWQVYLPPQIDADWELNSVFFPSTTEGWAAGVNHTQKRGVLLHFFTPRWDEVIPPEVSSDWEFDAVHFPSTYTGWASGTDYANQKGFLLQYEKGVWTDFTLPEISSNWALGNVRFASTNKVWAFGMDFANKRGVILRYSADAKETVSTPSTPNGPNNIAPNTSSVFYTGESLSSLDHSVQYFIDWGDGTNSGWLPVGTVGATKSWTVPGTYQIKAQARCDTDTLEVSKWSSGLSVTVSETPTPITLLSPSDGTPLSVCSLYSLPTFAWKAEGSFTGYEIHFSKTESFDTVAASEKASSTSILIDDNTWKKVLGIFGSFGTGSSSSVVSGGPVFWRVVGTRSDKTSVISDTLSIFIDPVQAVGNPMITDTSKSSIPTLSWENNCNIKFKVWFGNNPFFTHKTTVSFNIKNPDDNGGVFTKSLTSTQWTSVQAVTGRVTGSTVYWYVESWDAVNRRTITQPNEVFVITD